MTLEHLTGGYIYVDGEPLTHKNENGRRVELRAKQVAQTRKRIGMVFQQFNLFPNMTVMENIIEAPIHVLGKPKERSEEHTSELQSRFDLVCRLLLEKK